MQETHSRVFWTCNHERSHKSWKRHYLGNTPRKRERERERKISKQVVWYHQSVNGLYGKSCKWRRPSSNDAQLRSLIGIQSHFSDDITPTMDIYNWWIKLDTYQAPRKISYSLVIFNTENLGWIIMAPNWEPLLFYSLLYNASTLHQ